MNHKELRILGVQVHAVQIPDVVEQMECIILIGRPGVAAALIDSNTASITPFDFTRVGFREDQVGYIYPPVDSFPLPFKGVYREAELVARTHFSLPASKKTRRTRNAAATSQA